MVDDTTVMRNKLREILENNHYLILGEAINGVQAVNKYKDLLPDIVLMDITMPEMDGIEALKKIRKIDVDSKVIMCSGMVQQPIVMNAMLLGAVDFIVKPFNTKKVIRVVNKFI